MKENQNLLSYNLYSGGEYENSTNGFYRINTNTNIITSNDYSVIGEQSFKINIISDSTASLIIDRTTHNTGAILTGKLYIHVLSGSVTIRLQENTSGQKTDVVVNEGSDGLINISHTVSSTQQAQFLIIPQGEGTSYYIDNISLTTS